VGFNGMPVPYVLWSEIFAILFLNHDFIEDFLLKIEN